MLVQNFNYFFGFLTLLYLAAEVVHLDAVRYFTKPLLLLSLSLYFYQQVKKKRNSFTAFVQAGLFFSLLGDTVLLFAAQHELFFVLGLVLFLLAHVCYIFAFRWTIKNAKRESPAAFQLLASTIPFILASAGVFLLLKNSLGALFIPVIVYISIITLMGIAAALRYKKVPDKSFNLILAGAIFFMISDTVLAINKFHTAFPLAGVFIMSTYILAQYLIVK